MRAAEKVLDLAADGVPWAVRMLADRLDGKAKQHTELRGGVSFGGLAEILARISEKESSAEGEA